MPRLPTSLLRKARCIDPLLPLLLRPCRDLNAAQNELRWLREHVAKVAKARSVKKRDTLLGDMVRERAKGKPLQYILGTEYFGDLEIRCRPGVLIPRQETAASVTHLVKLLHAGRDLPSEIRVLDLCTGTGCIPLLFHHEFHANGSSPTSSLRLLGVDISEKALPLAQHNLALTRRFPHYVNNGSTEFLRADVLIDPYGDQTLDPPSLKAALNFSKTPPFWDILISNPPYISPKSYWKTTTRSVRGFEPKLALVPPAGSGSGSGERVTDTSQGDAFYPRLLAIAREVEAKIILFEVADLDQALRVARMARRLGFFDGVEIWRDQPDETEEGTTDTTPESEFPIRGAGNARSVLCWRGAGAAWLGKPLIDRKPSEDGDEQGEGGAKRSYVITPSFDYSRFEKL